MFAYRTPNSRNLHLFADGPIETTHYFKYLGVWLSPRLGWSKHIDELKKKCNIAIHGLRAIMRCHSVKPSVGVLFYKAVVRSVIEYGAPIWFATGFTDSLLDKICAIERKCLKLVLGLPKRTSNEDLFQVVSDKLPSFQWLRERLAELSFFYFNSQLTSSSHGGNLVRFCRQSPNPKSASPARFFLERLLGNGPLQPILEPIFEADEVETCNE